jgi:hypothetical protein
MTKGGNKHMRFEVVHGSRVMKGEEAKAFLVDVGRRMNERAEARLNRRVRRLGGCPERMSVAKAMFAVEQRLVEALWTLARLPNDRGIGFAQRNGVGYFHDYADKVEQAKAAGWLTTPPKPSPPDARAIDAMSEPLEWLRLLERGNAKLLSEGAMSRRGDMANPVRWSKIRKSLEMEHLTIRTLQRRYEQALRDLIASGVKA